MLTKILFTGIVIILVFIGARIRSSLVSRRNAVSPSTAHASIKSSGSPRSRTIPYLIAVGLVSSALVGYYWYWANWREVVAVRVINTVSGESVTYRAHKGSLKDRTFQTTDGLKVTLSEADRVEVHSGEADE